MPENQEVQAGATSENCTTTYTTKPRRPILGCPSIPQQRVRDKRRVIWERIVHEASQQSYMRQIRVTRYSTRGDKRREADKNVHERKRRLDNKIAPELCIRPDTY